MRSVQFLSASILAVILAVNLHAWFWPESWPAFADWLFLAINICILAAEAAWLQWLYRGAPIANRIEAAGLSLVFWPFVSLWPVHQVAWFAMLGGSFFVGLVLLYLGHRLKLRRRHQGNEQS